MKTKIILLIVISALATISFSFSGNNQREKIVTQDAGIEANTAEPIGGFVSEDKF